MPLTPAQETALNALVKGVRAKVLVQTLGGYAGTGKTTLVSELIEILSNAAVCAFTGKAANVLQRKGVKNASTIHRLIYEAEWNEEIKRYVFHKRNSLGCSAVIVDESSMVSREIYDHLLSFGKPIIFVGDHGQLEPVGSDKFNVMENPEYRLETIHRNAGEISRFAEWVRMGNVPGKFPGSSNGQVQFLTRADIRDSSLPFEVDQVICAYNKTRVAFNDGMRMEPVGGDGGGGVKVRVGEKVMCLRNNYEYGVFNGMQAHVTGVEHVADAYLLDLDSYGEEFAQIPVFPGQFGEEKTLPLTVAYDPRVPFDYAYCVTAHKSQGDEWDRVMVLEQKCPYWEHKRWLYTAVSRAREGVFVVRGF